MENETSAEGLPENGIPQEDVEDDDGVTTTDPQKKSKLSSFINKVKSVSSFTSSMSQNESFEDKPEEMDNLEEENAKNSKSGKLTKMIKKVQVATSLSKSPSLSSEQVPQQSLEDTESLPETDGESQQKPKNGAPSNENSPSKTLERQDSLEVPELQDDPKDEGNEDEDESTRKSKAIMNFMTAVKVARWVAKAYGYVTMKKAAYLRPENERSSLSSASSRRSSVCSERPESAFNAPSRRNSAVPTHLVGDEQADQKIVCDWFATSYGEVDKEYHEAYSRQILKEIREHLKENDTKPKVASWFG